MPPPHFLPQVPQPADDDDLTLAEIEEEELPRLRVAHMDLLLEDVPELPAPAPKPNVRKPKLRRTRPAQPAAVAPTRRPPRPKQMVRREEWVDRVPWSAEEFDGELADRVRRSEPLVEYVEQAGPTSGDHAMDEELLEVQFEDETQRAGRNGWQLH